MKRKYLAVVLIASLLAQSGGVWALDAGSARADCDEIKKAGKEAQLRYVQTFQPKQDPGKTFDDAISSCLDFITNFKISIPSMWDGMLEAMAKALMQRACQTARAQFDKAVGDATQSVNETVGTVPGVEVSTSTTSSQSGSGPGVGTTVQGDNGSTVRDTANRSVDRVVNGLK